MLDGTTEGAFGFEFLASGICRHVSVDHVSASNNEKDEKYAVRYNVKKGIPRIYLRDRREMFFLHSAVCPELGASFES